jgi:hypothetical protein
MFYVTVGFPEWDGYSVYQDPVFVGYVSRTGTDAVQMGVPAIESGTPVEGESVTIGVDIDSYVDISSVELYHGTDQVTWNTVAMTSVDDEHWTGDIPSYPEGTTVHYKVIVHTPEYGDFESVLGSYIVGSGTTTTTTTTTGEPPELPMELLILVAGIGAVFVIVLVAVSKRRK